MYARATKSSLPIAGTSRVATSTLLPRPSIQRKCECGGTCSRCAASALDAERRLSESDTVSAFTSPDAWRQRSGFDFSRIPLHPQSQLQQSPESGTAALPGLAIRRSRDGAGPAIPQFLASREITGGHGDRSRGALEVSDPSDRTEREADRVAELLLPSSHVSLGANHPGSIGVPQVRLAQREQDGGTSGSCTACGSGKRLGGMADSGSALPGHIRAEMEGAFGTDFSSVRIHTDSGAAQLSRSLNARAFTYGNDIFFNRGEYNPELASGKRLLAHELTHTVQQREGIAMLAREGEGRTVLQCVNENLSSAGVAAWLLAIVGTACGLVFGIAGSPSGPGAAGAAAFGAALCISGVIGASVGTVLGVISGCWNDVNFKSRVTYLSSNAGGTNASDTGNVSGTGDASGAA